MRIEVKPLVFRKANVRPDYEYLQSDEVLNHWFSIYRAEKEGYIANFYISGDCDNFLPGLPIL